MDITPVIPKYHYTLAGYGNGVFKLGQDAMHEGSLLIFADRVEPWAAEAFNAIDFTALRQWCAAQSDGQGIELLLIGTGHRMQPLPPEVKEQFRKENIAVEVMDTGAACRTYNVLLSEERRVGAALIAV